MFSEDAILEEVRRIPREIIICTGGWNNSGPCKSLEVFDSIEGAWKTLNLELPFDKAYHGIGLIDSKVIMLETY